MVRFDSSVSSFFGVSDAFVRDASEKVNEVAITMLDFMNLKFIADDSLFFQGQNLVLEFSSYFGKVSLKIEVREVLCEGVFFTFSCLILASNLNEFFIALRDCLAVFEEDFRRKKKQYVCSLRNMKRLRLMNELFLVFQHRLYKGIVKSLSYGGVRIIIDPAFFQLRRKRFTVILRFGSEELVFKGCLVCAVRPVFAGKKVFADILISLGNENALRRRLYELERTRRSR